MKKKLLFICAMMTITLCACHNKSANATSDSNKVHMMTDEERNKLADDVNNLFNAPEEFQEGVKSFQENGKYGFVNEAGEIVIPAKYQAVGVFNEGLCKVTINDKDGYINHQGELVIPAIYDFTNYFSQGLAAACKDGKFGYINPRGETVIKFEYDDARDFFEPNGFAAVKKNGEEGLIDRNGKIVMPIQYESAMSTNNGVATIFDGASAISVYNDGSYKVTTYQ